MRQPCAGDCCDGVICGNNGCDEVDICHQPLGGSCAGDRCNCSNLQQDCRGETDTCTLCAFPAERCELADDCCLNTSQCSTNADELESVCCFDQNTTATDCFSPSECCEGLVCVLQTGRCVEIG